MRTAEKQTPDCFVCRKHRGETATPGGVIFQDELVYITWPKR